MKITDFLKRQAKSAGIESQKELEAFLEANKEKLADLDIPDVAVNFIVDNLWNVEVAKTKDELKKHFAGQMLPGIEQGAMERAKAMGVSDSKIAEIHAETQSSGKRVNLYLEAANEILKEAGKKQKGSEEFMRQIQEEQNKVLALEKSKADEINSLKSKYESQFEDLTWQNEIGKVKWNKAIPEDIRSIALKNAINKEVEKSGGKLVFDADKRTFNIVNANDASMQVSKDGKILDYQTLFPLALQEHKLLDVEVPGGAGNTNPGNPFFVPPQNGQGNETKIPEYILNSLGSANKAVDFSKQ
jgi:hypothetical protein